MKKRVRRSGPPNARLAGTSGGRIVPPETPANVGWGDADWQSLYITARASVYRVRLSIPGIAVA